MKVRLSSRHFVGIVAKATKIKIKTKFMKYMYQGKKIPMKIVRKEKKQHTMKKKSFNIFLSLVVLAALCIYLVQSNSLLTQGYELQGIDKKSQELKRVKKELEGKSLELQSMTILAPKIEKLKMVEVDNAKYIDLQKNTVVKK